MGTRSSLHGLAPHDALLHFVVVDEETLITDGRRRGVRRCITAIRDRACGVACALPRRAEIVVGHSEEAVVDGDGDVRMREASEVAADATVPARVVAVLPRGQKPARSLGGSRDEVDLVLSELEPDLVVGERHPAVEVLGHVGDDPPLALYVHSNGGRRVEEECASVLETLEGEAATGRSRHRKRDGGTTILERNGWTQRQDSRRDSYLISASALTSLLVTDLLT